MSIAETRQRWAYIASPSYSGSTLLTFLLATHPRVATVGELKATSMGDVNQYDCSCGARIRQCQFWKSVAAEMKRRGAAFDVGDFGTHFKTHDNSLAERVLSMRVRGSVYEGARSAAIRMIPSVRRAAQRVLRRNQVLSRVFSQLLEGEVFLDGSKDPVRLRHFLKADLWDTKVIHLVRNGLGMANSYMRHHGASMAEAAAEWRDTHTAIQRLVRGMRDDQWIRIRYEDLCREPARVLKSIFGFLDLDPTLAATDYQSVEHHVLGNAMRLRSGSEITLDERWRDALTESDIRIFEWAAGQLNQAFGYDGVQCARRSPEGTLQNSMKGT